MCACVVGVRGSTGVCVFVVGGERVSVWVGGQE